MNSFYSLIFCSVFLWGITGCASEHRSDKYIHKKVLKACNSKRFTNLLNQAKNQTDIGHFQEALQTYRKAHTLCPMRDIEEQMAWLLAESGSAVKMLRYVNDRFHFVLSYPKALFVDKFLSDNGDGITLYDKAKTIELKAYGSLYGENIEELYHHTLKWSAEEKEYINYKVLKKGYFVISGMASKKERIFYQKTFFKEERSITVRLVYLAKDAKRYDMLVQDIVKKIRY